MFTAADPIIMAQMYIMVNSIVDVKNVPASIRVIRANIPRMNGAAENPMSLMVLSRLPFPLKTKTATICETMAHIMSFTSAITVTITAKAIGKIIHTPVMADATPPNMKPRNAHMKM